MPCRPRSERKAKGQTREEYNAYMRDYMRRYRIVGRTQNKTQSAKREDAAYDPLRDGPLRHRDLTAAIMGDPPVGRSALDRI